MTLQRYFRHFQQAEATILTASVLSKRAHFRSPLYYIYLDAEGWFFSGARLPLDETTLLYGVVEGDTFVETDQF